MLDTMLIQGQSVLGVEDFKYKELWTGQLTLFENTATLWFSPL